MANSLVTNLYPGFSGGPLVPSSAMTMLDGYESSAAGDSLGGYFSSNALQREVFLPFLQGKEWDFLIQNQLGNVSLGQIFPYNVYKLFRDISAAEATAGITLYRGFFINVEQSILAKPYAMNLYFYPQTSAATISAAVVVPTQDSISKKWYVPNIANETTAPSGVSWSSPTSGSPLALGNVGTNQEGYPGPGVSLPPFVWVWLKLVVSTAQPAYAYDRFGIVLIDSAGNQNVHAFYHSVFGGIASGSISGLQDGQVIQHLRGEDYTISLFDGSGNPIDPPSSTIICYRNGSRTNASLINERHVYPGVNPTTGTAHVCQKLSTGVYFHRFRPGWPGHWQLQFDCGGEYSLQTSVEVSPVA